ncbi:MAG: hypothetical protein DRJ43_04320 [Thermoprotei archaeon]|nr:MAG: hypothetical protein DRJ43_04320 [Thermoprotei archaeon]
MLRPGSSYSALNGNRGRVPYPSPLGVGNKALRYELRVWQDKLSRLTSMDSSPLFHVYVEIRHSASAVGTLSLRGHVEAFRVKQALDPATVQLLLSVKAGLK